MSLIYYEPMWVLYKKREPQQCYWDTINNQRVLIHCFEQGHYVCNCGKQKVKVNDGSGGWRGYQLKNKEKNDEPKSFKTS